MATTRFPTLLVLPATLWLAASLVRADEDCSITRPGWSEGAWRHKHQRRMLQLLLLQ
jgi:hypothetical protein